MEEYMTGTGQQLAVHTAEQCKGEPCVIHNQSNHHMVTWKTHWRSDRGLMERICPHGIGHPDPDDIAFKKRVYGEKFAQVESIHGCDGCCTRSTGVANDK